MVGKKRKNADLSTEIKAKKQQKKQNVSNGVLKERLADIGLFQKEAGKEILKEFLTPIKPEVFFTSVFQKHHEVFKRSGDDKFQRHCKNLFNKERFEAIAKLEKLQPVRDFNLMKYANGLRENHHVMDEYPDGDVPTTFSSYANIMQLVNDQRYTLQFHQPQRFCDDFWRVISALEEAFGALVGANIYWTPKDTQGLAPHWDSIDAFVLQLNGTKKWKVWKNNEMDLPPGESSPDLAEDELGEPLQIIEMEPGDMLYMPRGLIHCAHSGADESSIHVTFSVNEHNSVAHWLSANMSSLMNNLAEEHIFLRESIPRQFRESADRLKWLKETLLRVAESVNVETIPQEDPLRKDFYTNRLPPYKQPRTFGKLKQIDLNCSVRLTSREHIYIYEDDHVDVDGDDDDEEDDEKMGQMMSEDQLESLVAPFEGDEGDEDGWKKMKVEEMGSGDGKWKPETERDDEKEDEEDEEEDEDDDEGNDGDDEGENDEDEVFVMHSWQNERQNHMVTQSAPNCIRFPLSYKSSLEKLLELEPEEFIMLSELGLPPTEAVQFAVALWAEGLLRPKE